MLSFGFFDPLSLSILLLLEFSDGLQVLDKSVLSFDLILLSSIFRSLLILRPLLNLALQLIGVFPLLSEVDPLL